MASCEKSETLVSQRTPQKEPDPTTSHIGWVDHPCVPQVWTRIQSPACTRAGLEKVGQKGPLWRGTNLPFPPKSVISVFFGWSDPRSHPSPAFFLKSLLASRPNGPYRRRAMFSPNSFLPPHPTSIPRSPLHSPYRHKRRPADMVVQSVFFGGLPPGHTPPPPFF